MARADGIEVHTGSGTPPVIGGILCGETSGGTDITWLGADPGSWFTAGNWDVSVPDGTTDLVIVPSGTAQIDAAAVSGGDIDICGGTIDLQSGGSLTTTGWLMVADGGTLLLSGSTNVPSPIVIDGGNLRATTTGTLSSDLYLGDTGDVNISEAAGETLTLTGGFYNYTNSTNYKVVFGSQTDTGTIVFSPSDIAFGDGANVAFEIAGGTLQAGNDALGSLEAITMTVDDGATLDFNDQEPADTNIILDLLGAGTVTTGASDTTIITLGGADFSGSISGAGNLSVVSICYAGPSVCTDGIATLSGNNDFTGTTSVSNGGTLIVDGAISNTSAVTVEADGAMTVNGSVASTGAIENSGTLTVGAAGSLTTADAITLDAGVMTVDGTADATNGLAVNSGATLAGTGTVPQTQVAAGGIIAPGDDGIGTLQVNGGLLIVQGADYNLDVSSAAADKIDVTGAVGVAGTLNITMSSQPAAGTKFTILSATGGITGGLFLTGPTTPLGEIGPTLLYDANNVILDYEVATLSPDLPGNATQNETAVVAGIDNAIDPGTALPDAFQALGDLSPTDLATATTQLSGEIAADLPQVEATAIDPFLTVLLDRSGNRGADLNTTRRYRRHRGALSVWTSIYGQHTSITGDTSGTGSHTVSGSSIGWAAGVDAHVIRGLSAGAAFAYGHSTFSLNDSLGSGSSNNLQFGVHALAQLGRYAYLSGGIVYALQDITMHRAVTLPSAETFDAKFTAHDLAGRVEGGFKLRLSGSTQVTPFVAAQWASFDAPRSSETGTSDYALTYDANSVSNSRVELGAALDNNVRVSYNTKLYLYGSAAFAHAFESSQEAHASFGSLSGSDFVVQGAAPGANLALLTVDAEFKGRNGLSLGLEADGSVSQNSQSYFGTANLSYAW